MIFRASVPSVQATDLPRGSEHGVLGQDKLRWGPLESLMGAILAVPFLADVSHRKEIRLARKLINHYGSVWFSSSSSKPKKEMRLARKLINQYGSVWFDMVRYGSVWFGMVRYGSPPPPGPRKRFV